MKTPIIDFVKNYSDSGYVRLHMPGHKGKTYLGCENYDITEIDGADVLYSPNGIIKESENNATALFGSGHTYYSTQGSTLCIKAMLAVALQNSAEKNVRPFILAARNVHKAFIHACALLDIDAEWLYSEGSSHLCGCVITPEQLESALLRLNRLPIAVYLTSPDYLGNIQDIRGIAQICHKYGVMLLTDNAHGAYLKFCDSEIIRNSGKNIIHPIDAGADMCCDSAHKTLPVLTGGAYLHISDKISPVTGDMPREKLSLFASTSPSYLILQSLDLCNAYIENGYKEKLFEICAKLEILKDRVAEYGFVLTGDEPLKLVVDMSHKLGGGLGLAEYLRKNEIEIEFADRDFCVFMFSPENSESDLKKLETALLAYPLANKKTDMQEPFDGDKNKIVYAERAMSIRSAIFAASEIVDVNTAQGRVCASPTVSCPPAVPIVMSGEIINADHIKLLEYYGIEKVSVVK